MNRSIMMKKYGLDESQAYIEQSTLLEPNNFIPLWENFPFITIPGNRRRGKEGSFQRTQKAQIEVRWNPQVGVSEGKLVRSDKGNVWW